MSDTRSVAEQAAEHREDALFPEMNPGPVCRLDLDAIVLRANRAARNVFGQDLIGRSWRDVLPDLTREVWSRLVGGERVWVEAQVNESFFGFTLLRAPEVEEIFAYGTDITALKHAEKTVKEMARFPDMNPGPVLRLASDGQILLANRAARDLFQSDRLVGIRWQDLCPRMTDALWATVSGAHAPVDHEASVSTRHMLFTHTRDVEGDQVFVYGADLTALKTAERTLRQSERMATLGTLAAGVAHELNNPAAAVQRAAEQLQNSFGSLQEAQLALNKLPIQSETLDQLSALARDAKEKAAAPPDFDPLTRSDREYDAELWLEDHGIEESWDIAPALVGLGYGPGELEKLAHALPDGFVEPVVVWLARGYPVHAVLAEIRYGAGRISEIVGALKAYSYVGRAPVQAVDVNEGIRHTLIILQNKLKRGVTVDLSLDPALPTIQAFGGDLNQVWTNLIDNAADAMDGEGRIAIRTSVESDRVLVEVEDDGPGIPDAIQGRIFDPFFTTKEPGHGTGLGLNTTYNVVVKKHGGSIDLRSRPGSTCFTIRLPLILSDQVASESGGADAAGAEQPHEED